MIDGSSPVLAEFVLLSSAIKKQKKTSCFHLIFFLFFSDFLISTIDKINNSRYFVLSFSTCRLFFSSLFFFFFSRFYSLPRNLYFSFAKRIFSSVTAYLRSFFLHTLSSSSSSNFLAYLSRDSRNADASPTKLGDWPWSRSRFARGPVSLSSFSRGRRSTFFMGCSPKLSHAHQSLSNKKQLIRISCSVPTPRKSGRRRGQRACRFRDDLQPPTTCSREARFYRFAKILLLRFLRGSTLSLGNVLLYSNSAYFFFFFNNQTCFRITRLITFKQTFFSF